MYPFIEYPLQNRFLVLSAGWFKVEGQLKEMKRDAADAVDVGVTSDPQALDVTRACKD